MLRGLHLFFETRISPLLGAAPADGADERRLRLATAALFVEMMRADVEVSADERRHLEILVRETLGLDADETRELLASAEEEVDAAVEVFQFTRLVDQAFSPEQKVALVRQLWRLAYADAYVDRHEEHLLRKISNLLHVAHRDYLAAKLEAQAACS
jgi:uncharacterized tellurite resistance protein B-like protein